MNKSRSYLWLLATVVFAVCLTTYSLSYIVTRPSRIIPELGGDGIKNIFTYLYHSVYGHGYWFQGMNYPYGEHVVYTDGQPILSVTLNHLHGITMGDALTVLWWLVALSYVLSIVFIYKILLRFNVAPWASMLFAGLIALLTPQIVRLQGHYALSYCCVIPMLFYWTICYHDNARWRYCVYIFVIGVVMAFMHPYYAAMILIWASSYALGYVVVVRGRMGAKLRHVAPILGSAILVLAVVAVVMKVTDPVTDRPVTPYNTLYETCTRPKQLVTSYHSPVWRPLMQTKLKRYISDGGEGFAYLGIVVIITLLVCFVASALRTYRNRRITVVGEAVGFSPVWLFMAAVVLLFSMGVPFIWDMNLMNYLSIFKQFRSLGRFSWIFYYIVAIYSAVVIYDLYVRLAVRRRIVAYAVLILSLAIWSFEVSGNIKYSRNLAAIGVYNYDVMFSANEQNWSSFLQEHHHTNTDFQALLLLPYFHIGTEKLWVGDGSWLITLGSKAALQLHLPIVDVMMSRSSWSQAQKQVKLVAGQYADKPMLRDLRSSKPFLLLRFEDDSLSYDEQYLLQASDYIGHIQQCYVYACYPARINDDDRKNAAEIKNVLSVLSQPDTLLGNSHNCYINHFDANHSAVHLFGNGGLPAVTGDSAEIANVPVVVAADSELFELSCWLLLSDKDPRGANVNVQLRTAEGKVDTTADLLTRQSTDSYGMWFRSSRYFYIHRNIVSVRCVVVNDPNPSYLALDELVLRPAETTVISKAADGKVMVNNHLVAPTGN